MDEAMDAAFNFSNISLLGDNDLLYGKLELTAREIATLAVYGVMFCTGVAGNILVCVVIFKQPSMHTVTNFFLVSLAVADIIILSTAMPFEIHVNYLGGNHPWRLGVIVCKLAIFIPETATNASVLTILAFSVERYVAICYPLKSLAFSRLHRAKSIISAIWLISLVCAIPFAFDFGLTYVLYPKPHVECDASGLLIRDYYVGVISSIIFFVIPFTAMVYLYSRIALAIHTRASVGESRTLDPSTKSIIRMLAAVVFSFFLCWAPFHFQRLFFTYLAEQTEFLMEVNSWLYIVGGFSFYLSSTLNPILYNIMSAKYREAFQTALCGSIDCKTEEKSGTTFLSKI